MKIIVQIPAYNEEKLIKRVISLIPRGFHQNVKVEVLVIDDGSTDETVSEALEAGADFIVRHSRNRGLARAFETGIQASLENGADIIVNIDADLQYYPGDIPMLVDPIILGEAELVIGDRQIWRSKSFGLVKRISQIVGSKVVSLMAGQSVPDAVSGFRAYSRGAALDLNILSDFSYTTETLIQAGALGYKICSVPVARSDDLRPSRLAKSSMSFVFKQAVTIIRARIMYRPLRTFFWLGGVLLSVGVVPIVRFFYLFLDGDGSGNIQSLVLSACLIICAFLLFSLGILADLVSFNRKLLERHIRHAKGRWLSIR